MEQIAFGFLILNQIILSSVLTLIYIFYGDYLIKRFNLETRYPNLAKIISLRRKFQSYYFKLTIGWIVFSAGIQFIACLALLFPKLFF